MSGEDSAEGVRPPTQYDYAGWNDFYRDAMRYHETAHPDKRLVSDRIETLREYMSERVISDLGAFVRPHPRYRTTEGWDAWLSKVTRILKLRDDSARNFLTLDTLLQRFKNREISELQFWDGLDRLVAWEDITSAEQREWFWNSLSWDAQGRLTDECPCVDPHHEVWTSDEPGAHENAEQELSQYMEYLILGASIKAETRAVLWLMLAEVCTLALFIVSLVHTIKDHGETPWTLGVMFGALLAIFQSVFLIIGIHSLHRLREVRNCLRPESQKGSLLASRT